MSELLNTNNPLLEKLRIVHGTTIALPSRGLLYPEGVLDPNVLDGEIRIHPMTIRDEILMRTPDALFSGETIQRVIGRCAPDVLQPLKLHFTDLDFIMLALRKISYGPELEINFQHDCEDSKGHSYVVNIDERLNDCIHLDPLLVTEQYELHLPEFNQTVHFKPLNAEDMIAILQPDIEWSKEDEEREMIQMAITQISAVDDITDRAHIYEWAAQIPARAMRDVRIKLEKLSRWGVTYKFGIKCRDCGQPIDADIPLNPVSFFT